MDYISFHMQWSLEAATVNFDFLNVRKRFLTFAQTDCKEKIIVLNLEIQT